MIFYLSMGFTSVYLHIPFCRRRCGYCDFNTFAGLSKLIPEYVKALCSEIENAAKYQLNDTFIHTIFFGGGTPSLLTPTQVNEILKTIRQNFSLLPDAEISLEANPGTVSEESLAGYALAGVNRISYGMQSASTEDLHLLDRQHRYEDVLDAVKFAHLARIDRVNLDLIYGIPQQTLERWLWSLQMAVNTGVEHLSLYSLTVEEGTPLHRWVEKGLLPMPDDDLAAEMYEKAQEMLSTNGYHQYEISNWARGEAARCRHNLQYWRYEPYYGFGAGAHGFINGTRVENLGGVAAYIHSILSTVGKEEYPAAKEINPLSDWDQMQEMLMVGLRMTEEGLSFQRFQERFGYPLENVFAKQIGLLQKEELLEFVESPEMRLRLTPKGRLLGNQVFMQFVGNKKPDFVANKVQ